MKSLKGSNQNYNKVTYLRICLKCQFANISRLIAISIKSEKSARNIQV